MEVIVDAHPEVEQYSIVARAGSTQRAARRPRGLGPRSPRRRGGDMPFSPNCSVGTDLVLNGAVLEEYSYKCACPPKVGSCPQLIKGGARQPGVHRSRLHHHPRPFSARAARPVPPSPAPEPRPSRSKRHGSPLRAAIRTVVVVDIGRALGTLYTTVEV
ncbi:unnamed protein product [Spodoptera exigua]|nr:unnamed protein product [Spodoptera exigua]